MLTLAEPVAHGKCTERNKGHCLQLQARRWSWCALVILAGLAGCNSDSNGSIKPQSLVLQTKVELSDGTTLAVIAENDRAISLRTSDGQLVPIKRGVAIVGDELVVQAANGQLTAYRQPSAINEQLDQLPYVYLKQGTLEELVIDGCQGEPYLHPDDQSFYWAARTCTNPDCGSHSMGSGDRPYLFIKQLPGVKLMPSGDRVDFTGVPPKVLEAPIVCPVCNKKEHVVDYLPAETIQRKQSLTAELTQVRTARDQATQGR